MTLTTKGHKRTPVKSLYFLLAIIGEELVSWKRRVESIVITQTLFVKTYLSSAAIILFTFGGLSLAQINGSLSHEASSFEFYRSLRTAEVVVKGSSAIPKEDSSVLVATAFDSADNYLREIFGSPVPPKVSAAEAVIKQPLKSPLPESVIDNGPPPLPTYLDYVGSQISSRYLLWPMRGGMVTSRFGMRWGRMHQGTDIAAPMGTPVFAAADGKVIFSGWEGGYGNLVVVEHGDGVKTKYGHCSKLLVAVGEFVRQGDIIGKVGNTGNSTGPHLHYEVIREGHASNPENFTRRR